MLERFKQKGYRVTPQRQEILRCFLSGGKHYSAEEVHRRVRRKFPSISLDTVYRNLSTLRELGLLETLNFEDGKIRYELARENTHHHHLICMKCGGSQELDFCPLQFIDDSLLKDRNFKMERHSFEIFGYCGSCSKAQ